MNDKELTGTKQAQRNNIASADDCASECSKLAWCIGYNYFTVTGLDKSLHRRCDLYAKITGTRTKVGVISARCDGGK